MNVPLTPENLKGAFGILFAKLDGLIPESLPVNPEHPNLQWAVFGLSLKIISNCKAAHTLLFSNFLSEALIVMRSAYEALATMRYLIKYPGEVEHYQNFSEAVEFKDFLSSYEISIYRMFEKPKANYEERLKYIKELGILKEKRYFKNSAPKSEPEKVESSEIEPKNQFVSINQILKKLGEEPEDIYYGSLEDTRVFLYHKASQHAHAHWHEVQAYHMGIDTAGSNIEVSINGELTLCELVILLYITLHSLEKCGPVPDLLKNLDAEMVYAQEVSRAAMKAVHPPPTERIKIYRANEMPK